MMKILTFFSAILLSTTLLTFAAVADTWEERLAVAKEYNDAAIADMDMDALIRTMWQPMPEMMGVNATKQQEQQIHAIYMNAFEKPLLQLMDGQAEIMADMFTLKELETLRDFYATPTGRKVMQKMPQMMEQINPQIIRMVEGTLPAIVPKLRNILQSTE